MIIDFHAHTFPEKIAASTLEKLSQASRTRPFTGGTNAALLASMERAGIGLSVVLPVATNPRQVHKVNDSSAAVNEAFGGKGIRSFGCIHPDCEDWHAELGRVAELGLLGVKIHPVYQNTDIDALPFLRILDRCGELGLIVAAHTGLDIGFPGVVHCSPAQLRHAMEQVGPVKFVAAHMGGWKNWPEVCQLLADTAVYLDTSFSTGRITPLEEGVYDEAFLTLLDERQFMDMAALFGPERIVFGTDCPWTDQRESLAWLQALPMPEGDKVAILGGNAQKLLGL